MSRAYRLIAKIRCNLNDISYLSERERIGSVVERLTRDQRAAGLSLNGVTVLCP